MTFTAVWLMARKADMPTVCPQLSGSLDSLPLVENNKRRAKVKSSQGQGIIKQVVLKSMFYLIFKLMQENVS